MKRQDKDWTTVILPKRKFLALGLHNLWDYRYLVGLFVRRDLRAAYIQTILGPAWLVMPPIINAVVFTVIFGHLAKLSADGAPHFLFYMSGIVMWGFFSNCVIGNASTFSTQASLFNKVYFPRIIVLIANLITAFVSTFIQMLILLVFVFYAYYMEWIPGISAAFFMLPLLFLGTAILALGVGCILSAITARYRDVSFVLTYMLQIWMYATTVIYPLSSVPEKYQLLAQINPMTPIVETFRHAVLGTGSISWTGLAMSASLTIIILFIGLAIFNATEETAMDTV